MTDKAISHNIVKKRWVIKIGSALLTNNGLGLDRAAMAAWVSQMAALCQDEYDIILVSSGSIAEGLVRLGWQQRPTALDQLQAAASVGQAGLVQAYEQELSKFNRVAAQILVTHGDLNNNKRKSNARATISRLLEVGALPIINENDSIATEEIRFGDNDNLAGVIVNLMKAEKLVIMTDQRGLFSEDPRNNPNARFIETAKVSNPALENMASPTGGTLGRGGMQTKIFAAKTAATTGANTVICDGREPNVLLRLAAGDAVGTHLVLS